MNNGFSAQFQFDETDYSNTEYIQDMLKDYEQFKRNTSPKATPKSEQRYRNGGGDVQNNVTKFDLKDLKQMHDQNSSVEGGRNKPNLQIDQNMTAFSNIIDTTKATLEGVSGNYV